MQQAFLYPHPKRIWLKLTLVVASLLVVGCFAQLKPAVAAACTQPSADYGTVTETLSVPSTGNYQVWSHMMVPNTTDNSYMLEVEGSGSVNCYMVGGVSTIPAQTWTWVDDQAGTGTPIVLNNLTAGTYTVKLIGTVPGIELDRLIFTQDTSCQPTGNGDNCANPANTTPPTVTLTAPLSGATVSGTTILSAIATDNIAVTSVSFYVDNGTIPVGTVMAPTGAGTTLPNSYSYSLNTAQFPDGTHTISAKATDSAGNIGATVPIDVNFSNANTIDSQAPIVTIAKPTNGMNVNNVTDISGTATDNVGVTKIVIEVDGNTADTVSYSSAEPSASFGYNWNTAALSNGTHAIEVLAYDAAGNVGTDLITVTVLNGNTTPPSIPTGLKAVASSYKDINLTWQASTGGTGLAGYYVLRNGVTIAQVGPVVSYSDTSVAASTTYTYQLMAFDQAGNVSSLSTPASVTTPAVQDKTPPSVPTALSATAVSSNQINLAWHASTDNVGVTGYDVYRSTAVPIIKCSTTIRCPHIIRAPIIVRIASNVPSTTYGDSALSTNTLYTYYVAAVDGAGNTSVTSSPASATTFKTIPPVIVSTGTVVGTISHTGTANFKSANIELAYGGRTYLYSTNSKGTYRVPSVPNGTHTVTYSATGFITKHVNVSVKAGQTKTSNVTLERS